MQSLACGGACEVVLDECFSKLAKVASFVGRNPDDAFAGSANDHAPDR